MIEFDNVSKVYQNKWTALSNVSFKVEKGEFLFITGPTGAGKTTILKLIYGEELPTTGKVIVNNKNVSLIKKKELPFYRRNIGIIFQDFKLLYDRTVYENLEFVLKAIGTKEDEIREKIIRTLTRLGMVHKKDCYPYQLSGGEQQKVAIARALVKDPEIILADEPTGNIDEEASKEIINIFKEINLMGATVIMATHHSELPQILKKRRLHIVSGKIVYD
ncbi:MAG: cell division ATP-binding protein FtsE [candidate division WOR-3 bacterium]|nr:cell division ATP-binding protein FtsE [candidate division WOR-3 bacterium]MCX7836804.1 cell division ATP-binding protein FtsE [candidate division WOR-3 bacterium]MDW8113879.1 cell division ATP-binding protein FtsE [candidate division WOR-3 bacterium]